MFIDSDLDLGSENMLVSIVDYLEKKAGGSLWRRLYHKLVFLIELEYYKKHGKKLSGAGFYSYKYGPFSQDVAFVLDSPQRCDDLPDEVKEVIDDVMNRWWTGDQQADFERIIQYVHSLYVYHATPYKGDYNFDHFELTELNMSVESKTELTGDKLENEKSRMAQEIARRCQA